MNHYALLNLCSPLSAHPYNIGLPQQPVKENMAETEAISVKYIQGDLWVPMEGHKHPPGTGSLATLADCVIRVKKGSGTGRRNQIIFSLHSSES